jgi:4-amino-4-deoxy-L-arabinose transferase-like glycosyltransferase
MTGESPRGGRAAALAVLAIVVFTAAVRIRLADVPLERDEGEYAYAGQLLLAGVPPYAQAYNMKFPGTYYAYAVILALGGQSARAIHLGLLVVNVATILLVFTLAARLFGRALAVVAAGLFALLALDRGVMGPWAHATHFALLFALAGLVLVERRPTRAGPLLLAGLLLGIAVSMKQHAMFYLVAGLAIVGYDRLVGERRSVRAAARAALWLVLGFGLPLAALIGLLLAQGVFAKFWFWTVRYSTHYLARVPVADALPNLGDGLARVAGKTLALWLLAAVGLLSLVVGGWPVRTRVILLGLAAASCLAICPGFYFREHYFVLLLPALALLGATAIAAAERLWLRAGRTPRTAQLGALALALLGAGHYLGSERHYLFAMSTDELSRSRYQANLFADAVAIAAYVREHSPPTERLAVLGSEPEMFFYAQRRSATAHIYAYPLMEPQPYARQMQEEMIREIETARPAFLITVKAFPSWLARPDSDRTIFAWARGYTRAYYEEVGRVDGDGTGKTELRFSGPGLAPAPPDETLARVYRRKPDTEPAPSIR